MEVLAATCTDVRHPPAAMVDGNLRTFWATTGLFPHEAVLRLPAKASLARLRLRCANVKRLVFERCDGASPINWAPYVEQELPDVDGIQELTITTPPFPVTYLKLRIASAFVEHAFIYSVEADGSR